LSADLGSGPLAGYALAGAALVLFAASILLTRLATARVALSTGFVVSLAVNVLVAALLFAVELAVRRGPIAFDAGGVLAFALAGVLTTYLGRWFFYGCVERLGPAKASTFHISSPLVTAVLGATFLGERLPAAAIAAMVATSIGLYLVATSRRSVPPSVVAADGIGVAAPAGLSSRVDAWLRSGVALGVGASASYAVGNLLRGLGIARWDEAIAGALLGALAALALQLAVQRGRGRTFAALRTADRRGVALYATIGCTTIVAQVLTIAAMAHAPVAIVALITLCTPLLVFPASFLLLGNEEGITARAVLGAALALAGIAAIVLR
jgi:drug/metabolite transporter (DMT)-like permease